MKRVSVRLSDEADQAVRQAAKADGVSLSQWLVRAASEELRRPKLDDPDRSKSMLRPRPPREGVS